MMEQLELPKKIMRLKELVEYGFPEGFLMDAFCDKDQDFAIKMNPAKRNSPIIFYTDGLKKYWERKVRNQAEINRRNTGVFK